MFQGVSNKIVPDDEKKILRFWEEYNIFIKSIQKRKGCPHYVFYEGPPTANAKPHIGHVLTKAIKDLFPRYKTMCGYYCYRKAGWDTHGLPVEIEVEKELGFEGKRQIELYGIEHFIKKCKESVWKYKNEWEKMCKRGGFWIDLENPYITCTNEYIETVWLILKQLWEKELLYKKNKVVPYCPRCGTSLSSHEVAQGYKEIEDFSLFVKFEIKGMPKHYFLVWTTTPWTLISNVALAVKGSAEYAFVKIENSKEILILAKERLPFIITQPYHIEKVELGKSLKDLDYIPLFNFCKIDRKFHYVVTSDFVNMDEGTGIVHISPAFGEDDSRLGEEYNLPFLKPVDLEGKFTSEVTPWKGKFVKSVEKEIINYLKKENKLYKSEIHKHTYPFCWRCDTPLIYYAKDSWFIKTTAIKKELLEEIDKINWLPDYIGKGRFKDFLNNLVDWAVSRDRFWGTPLNIWNCTSCNYFYCIGSLKELQEKTTAKINLDSVDLHRPYIDKIILKCPKCSKEMRRVPQVIDCWFDSGAMPYAQFHYPFENRDLFEKNFPADFISEAVDQTRGWFYSLLAIGMLLSKKSPYKNVIVVGFIQDKKGQKMSKSKGNVVYADSILETYGADSLRWYLYSSTNPWTSRKFSEQAIIKVKNNFLGTLKNIYYFFVTYANIEKIDIKKIMFLFRKDLLLIDGFYPDYTVLFLM